MLKLLGWMTAALLAIGVNETASADVIDHVGFDMAKIQELLMQNAKAAGINWKVGDRAVYSVKSGIVKGQLNWYVREDDTAGYWTQQDVNLGLFGKQKLEILFNKRTGQIQRVLVNGEEKPAPTPETQDTLETRETNITVPAGAFTCTYTKMKDKKSGEVAEMWANPQRVPMAGVLKGISPSPVGKVTIQLQSFSFAP